LLVSIRILDNFLGFDFHVLRLGDF